MNRSLTPLALLIGVLALLGVPAPWGALDLGVAAAHAQTIGGPGVFSGDSDAVQGIHTSDSPRTLCLTLVGLKGMTRALFDLAPDFAVTKDETNSACRDEVTDVAVQCIGEKCEVEWRVDAVALQGPQGPAGPEGPAGADGSDGADGLPGNLALAGMSCPPGSFVNGFDLSGNLICAGITTPVCGNGVLESGEQCDDGNTADGDGCSASCQQEAATVCGNGVVEFGEQCDDGNTTAGDGCSASCQLETGLPPETPGDLVITEVMYNPTAVSDGAGEWFEIYNPTNTDFELQGLEIRDDEANLFVIDVSLVVPANGFVVLGNNADVTTNGGVPVNFQYPTFFLGNMGDEIEILNGYTSIDKVVYPSTFSNAGSAASLDPDFFDAWSNDNTDNWCDAIDPLTSGDTGTPGAINPDCP